MAYFDNSPRLTPDLQPLRRREKAGLILFLLCVIAFGVLVEIRSVYLSTRKTDLNCYLRAGWAVREHKDIYSVTDDNWWHFAYPPLFAVAMVPLADAPNGEDRPFMLPYRVSVAIWYLISVCCLWFAVHWFCKALEENCPNRAIGNIPTGCRRWWGMRIGSILMCVAPIGCTLSRGQVNLLLLLLIAGMFRATVRQRHFASGIWLAAAICLKVIPAFLLLFPIIRRDGRALLGTAFGLLMGVAVIPAMVWGPEVMHVHERMFDSVIAPGLNVGGNRVRDKELMETTATDNQSLQSVLHNYQHPDFASRPPRPDGDTSLAHWFIGGLLTIGLIVAFGRSHGGPWFPRGAWEPEPNGSHAPRGNQDPLRLLLLLGGLAVVMVPISPVSHTHYFCLALPAIVAQLCMSARPGTLRPAAVPFGAALVAGVLFALPMIPFCEERREIGLSLIGCLLLWGITVRQLCESRIPIFAHSPCPAPTI